MTATGNDGVVEMPGAILAIRLVQSHRPSFSRRLFP
jgi:hypothetical protein